MADSTINDAFRDTAAQANAMFDKLEAQGGASETPTPAVVPASSTPEPVATPTPEPTPTTPTPLDVSDDTPVRIKVGGQEKVVSAKDYREILQRTDVFTQRQQGLAQQARQLEEHYAQREAYLQQQAQALAQVQQQLSTQADPVQRLVQALQPQPKAQDPNEIATIGELKTALSTLQQQLVQAKQSDDQRLAQALNAQLDQVRQEMVLAADQQRFDRAVQEVMNSPDGQMLLAINPKAEALLRWETFQMGPQNADEAIRDLGIYAKGWSEKVRGHFNQQQTTQAVVAAKNVMEPPTGHVAPPAAQSKPVALKKDGSIDWDALRNKALAIMESN